MAREVPIGAQGEAEETVEFQHTLTAHNPALPPVYSTPHMVRLMEMAAFHALQSYCDGDEISVGTAINIEHRAASGIGAAVNQNPAGGSWPRPVRCSTTGIPARSRIEWAGRRRSPMSSMLTASMPTSRAP